MAVNNSNNLTQTGTYRGVRSCCLTCRVLNALTELVCTVPTYSSVHLPPLFTGPVPRGPNRTRLADMSVALTSTVPPPHPHPSPPHPLKCGVSAGAGVSTHMSMAYVVNNIMLRIGGVNRRLDWNCLRLGFVSCCCTLVWFVCFLLLPLFCFPFFLFFSNPTKWMCFPSHFDFFPMTFLVNFILGHLHVG